MGSRPRLLGGRLCAGTTVWGRAVHFHGNDGMWSMGQWKACTTASRTLSRCDLDATIDLVDLPPPSALRSSSVVERSAVNRLVAGSNPACGASLVTLMSDSTAPRLAQSFSARVRRLPVRLRTPDAARRLGWAEPELARRISRGCGAWKWFCGRTPISQGCGRWPRPPRSSRT